MVIDLRASSGVDAEAAAWLARVHGPHRSQATEAGLTDWLAADPAHREAFERAIEIWESLPGLAPVSTLPQVTVGAAAEGRHASRRRVTAAIGLAAFFAIGGGYVWLNKAPVYQTEHGQQQVVTLDDGSRVALNTDSRLVTYLTADERRVSLERGEAMFDVAKDASRPFVVVAGDERIRALGTSFVVRRMDNKLQVTLIEGRVEVSKRTGKADARLAVLTRGQRITVTPAAGAMLDRPSAEAATAWRRGQVMFEDVSLLEAAEELNRYGTERLVVGDPALGSIRISGVFAAGDVAESARAIAELHHLRIEDQGQEVRLVRH